MSVSISREDVARFRDSGMITIDFGFDMTLLDEIVHAVEPLYARAVERGAPHAGRLQDAWCEIEGCRRLAADRRVLDALQMLFGRRALPYQTLNFPYPTSQPVHADTIHFATDPPGYHAAVWVALEDVSEENGALVYYPGTHKRPELSMLDVGLRPTYDDYPEYEAKLREIIASEGLKPERCCLKKGEAVIWNSNLLHGGPAGTDASRSRHSQVTHYTFVGCKYYTPLTSGRVLRSYRFPQWIPSGPIESRPFGTELPLTITQRIVRKLTLSRYLASDLLRSLRPS